MKKRFIVIVSMFATLSVIIGIASLSKIRHENRELEKSLSGNLLIELDCSAGVAKYNLSDKSQKIIAKETSQDISNCYYNKKSNSLVYELYGSKIDDNETYIISNGKKINIDTGDNYCLDSCVLTGGYVYLIKHNGDETSYILYQIDPDTQKYNTFNLIDYPHITATQSKRLYFSCNELTKIKNYYLENNEIHPCSVDVSSIVAANDDCVVLNENGRLMVYDAGTWNIQYSVRIFDMPYRAVLSPDSNKLLYCVPTFNDEIDQSSECYYYTFSKAILLDFESGIQLKYNNKNRIRGFIDWIE